MKTLPQIYHTLNDKIANLCEGCPITANYHVSDMWIKDNCYSWQYNGVAAFDDVVGWCEDQFGNNWAWSFETLYFKYERDYMLFIMKWAS